MKDGLRPRRTWVAGEIALKSMKADAAKAQGGASGPHGPWRRRAESWELRAAMSMARLWRDKGERNEAGELLAPWLRHA